MDNRSDNKKNQSSRNYQNRSRRSGDVDSNISQSGRNSRSGGYASGNRSRTSGGLYQDSGYQSSKVVKKIENPRFYERENPEANMRRRGKTASDFENEKREYSPSNYRRTTENTSTRRTEMSGRDRSNDDVRTRKNQDGIPEFESFGRNTGSSERKRADRSFLYETDTDKRLSREPKDTPRRVVDNTEETHRGGGLFGGNDVDDDTDAFSDDENAVSSRASRKEKAAERVASKRQEKQRRKDIMSRSDDRSFRRRAVSKKRQKKIRSEQIFKALICILIIVAVLVITLAGGDYEDPYGTSYVTNGSISFSTRANSCFIREEEVYKAPVSGILVAAVNEGEKVAAGTDIAFVTTAEHTDVVAKLADVENKIETVKNAGSNSLDAFSDDVKHLDNQIAEVSRKLALSQANGDLSKYNELKNEIDSLYSKRSELISDSQSGNSYLASLERERESLLNKLKTYTHPITATSAGVVSFNIDGHESEFTSYAEKLSSSIDSVAITPATVEAAGGASQNYIGKSISSGSNVVKVITSSEYFVVSVASDDVKVKLDSTVSLKSVNREYGADVKILSSNYTAGKTVILSKTSKSLVSSLPSRCVESDIITGSYDGMKVPLSALTEFDKAGTTARLTLLEANYVVYAYVDILAKDNEYAIISNKSSFADAEMIGPDGAPIEDDSPTVSVNDIYILNPSFVSEGELMK